MPAPGLVAAFKLYGLPANTIENFRHRAGALTPPPAIDQRAPVFRPLREFFFQVTGDVVGHQRGTGFFGVERRGLLVQRADACTFLVVKHRRRDCARQVVFGVLCGRAHIDNVVVPANQWTR